MNIDQEYLKSLFDYDPVTGIFTRKNRPLEHFHSLREWKTYHSRDAGKRAGGIDFDRTGYPRRRIRVGSKKYLEHRLAWLYMTGSWPKYEIDHMDRDSTNNTWSNLRQVTHEENSRNKSMQINNKSGAAGVVWNKKNKNWNVSIKIDGKNNHVGCFWNKGEALEAAYKARNDAGYFHGSGLSHAHYRS